MTYTHLTTDELVLIESYGLLRQDGLPKKMDFNEVNATYIQSIASRRNNIPRKSLNYKTVNCRIKLATLK